MKKFFFFLITLAIVSCQSDYYFPEIEGTTFEKSDAKVSGLSQIPDTLFLEQSDVQLCNEIELGLWEEKMYFVCLDIIQAHWEIWHFRRILPAELSGRIDERLADEEEQSLKDLIECVCIWEKDPECSDVMCEYPSYDDFKYLMEEMQ